MNKNNVSIATITWARDSHEEKLLRKSLIRLAELNIQVFVTDGGSNGDFLNFLENFSNFHILSTDGRGVWAQVKNSLAGAYSSGSDFILYTEPDKYDFFDHSLPKMIDDATVFQQSGIITASRSEAGFASFPAFQQMTETTINNCCAEIIDKTADYTYGPFLMNSRLVPYLYLVNEDIGWGWRPYIFGIAHRLGYNIETYTGDFLCPSAQQEDSAAERVYRMRQLSQNIQGVILSTTVKIADE
jgi:hypothetical protein